MANKQQQIFAKIVLQKALDAAELEQLLAEFSDPESVALSKQRKS